jgi:ABC-2 type transport system ATP-binding protein
MKPGEIYGLVGPDGAGKRRHCACSPGAHPSSGSAIVAGFDVLRDPERVKHHISYMSQRFGLYEDLTVNENIRFYAGIFGVSSANRERRASTLLQAAGMSPLENGSQESFPGYEAEIRFDMRAATYAQVILLDEPTNGGTPVSRRDFWRISLLSSWRKRCNTISTFYLDEAERCHRVALLHQVDFFILTRPQS